MWKLVAVVALAAALSGCALFCKIPAIGTFEPQCPAEETTPAGSATPTPTP